MDPSVQMSDSGGPPRRIPSRSGTSCPESGAFMTARVDGRPQRAVPRLSGRRLLVAGLGHVGLGVARDAVAAGYELTGLGAEPEKVVRLIDGLAGEDEAATVLADAIGAGRCRITDDSRSCEGFDTAVLVPDGRPVDPAESGPLEVLAAALAPHVRPGVLVVIAGTSQAATEGELLSATVELLSGLRAGVDFDLGFALAGSVPSGGSPPTIVSGVDTRSARRTAALYRNIGRSAAPVSPVAAAELVALLQTALLARWGPGCGGPS